MANFVSFNCTNCTGYEANNNSCFVHWKVQFYVGKTLDICEMKIKTLNPQKRFINEAEVCSMFKVTGR